MYSLLVYNENHIQTIQYTKNIHGTASLVEAVSTIQKERKSTGHHKIQFCIMFMCKCWQKWKEKNYEKSQKQDFEAMEPSKKKILLEKKQVRDMANKDELKMK